MPHVVNGCGTWYLGKKNLESYQGTCGACGRHATLTSFDTTLYLVFLMIPILPLKKRHVVDMCPHCHKHLAISPKEWQEHKNKEITQAREEFHRDPDQERAKAVLGKILAFRDRGQLEAFIPEALNHFPQNAEMYHLIGQIQMEFNLLEQAEQTLIEANQIDPDKQEIRETLGEIFIRKLEPDNAEAFLSHIVEEGITNKVFYLLRVAGAYQGLGEHQKALGMLDRAIKLKPELGQDKEFRKLRKVSEKNQNTGKAVRPKWLVTAGELGVWDHKDLVGRIARVVPVVLAVVLLSLYLFFAVRRGAHREIYLVNGTGHAYTVSVNGESKKLFPKIPSKMEIPEGTLKIQPREGCPGVETFTVNIATNFFLRPFQKRIFVINPDKVAVLVRGTTWYVPENKPNNMEPVFEFFSSANFHEFSGVDYLFEPFPHTISMSGSAPLPKTRLYLMGQDYTTSYSNELLSYLEQLDKEKAAAFIQEYLRHENEDELLIGMLAQIVEPGEFLKMAEGHVKARPIQLHWHRSYQDTKEKTEANDSLEREYLDHLAQDPANKELLYLAGRVTRQPKKAMELMKQAAAEPDPVPQALMGLRYAYTSCGEFTEGLACARKAARMYPENENYGNALLQSLMASRSWNEALELIYHHKQIDPQNSRYCVQEIMVLAMAGRLPEAQRQIDALMQRENYNSADTRAQEARNHLLNLAMYLGGDYAGAMNNYLKGENPWYQMIAALEKNELERAEKIAAENKYDDLQNQVLLYIGETRAGNVKEAEKHLEAIVKELEKGSYEQKRFAAALKSGREADHEELLLLPMETDVKKLIAAAMAFRFPERQKEYMELACRLWFDLAPPVHYIQSLVK